MDKFQELLWDLGELIKLPLHVDKNHACNLLLDEELEVQMQLDKGEENFLLYAFLSDLPPGKFRENVLQGALKANGSLSCPGTLAFQERKNLLILHQFLPLLSLTGNKLLERLEQFIEEAEEWRAAVKRGEAAPAKYLTLPTKPPPFLQ